MVFDRAYLDFDHLFDLFVRGVFWVTRTKSNLSFRVVRRRKIPKGSKILADEEVVIANKKDFLGKSGVLCLSTCSCAFMPTFRAGIIASPGSLPS